MKIQQRRPSADRLRAPKQPWRSYFPREPDIPGAFLLRCIWAELGCFVDCAGSLFPRSTPLAMRLGRFSDIACPMSDEPVPSVCRMPHSSLQKARQHLATSYLLVEGFVQFRSPLARRKLAISPIVGQGQPQCVPKSNRSR